MTSPTIQQTFDLALTEHKANRLDEAERLYRQILAQQPNHAQALHYLGIIAARTERYDVAVDLFRRAISSEPLWPKAHYNLGNALRDLGRLDEAIAAYRQALVFQPGFAEALINLGNALKAKGTLEPAIAAYRQAMAIKPDFPEAHYNLGNALHANGQLDEAIIAFRRVLAFKPDYPEAHNNLGNVLQAKGQTDQAIAAWRQTIALKPNHPEAHNNLGLALKEAGQLDEAIAACRQAIAINPEYAGAYSNLGNALKAKGQLQEAMDAYRQAIAINPNHAGAYCNLGVAFKDAGQMDEALAAYRQAIALNPKLAEAYNNLGVALRDTGQLDEAIAAGRQAITLKPNYPEAYSNLGVALKDTGQLDEAVAACRQAIALKPAFAGAHSNLILTLHYHPDFDAAAIAQEHRRWNEQHAEPLKRHIPVHANDHSPNRRLRIGYVSADFCTHASAYFLVPLLENHDPEQVELFCYAQSLRVDSITRRLQQCAAQWRCTVGLSDEQMARPIREDGIDILVDLKLHTADNRLLVFARKPAPVQATWLGYPGSTGLTAIDYRLSDPYLDPPGMDESVYSEQTIRLPETFWCYHPLAETDIPVHSLPAQASNSITFGCLNNFSKINGRHLALWADILQKVPNSRLLLLAKHGRHRQETLQFLAQHGVESARVEFLDPRPRQQYLEIYHRIDVGLDSFPYNGHTTSLDSFWMGVPVVTLVGQTAVSRAGWCQLSNLGLPELAAQTPEQFVQIAVDLANDLPRLMHLRSTLRQQMESSPLMDAPRFASHIESAYRQMWKQWIASGK